VEPKSWPVADDRHVVVLRVEPVAVPPCLVDGRVFQRVSGRSDPILDQSVLLDLTRKGIAALERARNAAVNGAIALAFREQRLKSHSLAIALAPSAPDANASRRVFWRSWDAIVAEQLGELSELPRSWGVSPGLRGEHHRTSSTMKLEGAGYSGATWIVESHSDGTIAVAWRDDADSVGVNEAVSDYWLGKPWRIAADLSLSLGGRGPAFLAVATSGSETGRASLRALKIPSSFDSRPSRRLPVMRLSASVGRCCERTITAHEPES
jgi:hypothetical protein